MSLLFKIPMLGLAWPNWHLTRDVSPILEAEAILTLRQALPRLSAELERARRYRRPLSIVVLGHDDGSAANGEFSAVDGNGNGNGNGATGRNGQHLPGMDVPEPLFSARLAFVLRKTLRESDIVMHAATQGCCVVGMPEVDAVEARKAVDRLNEVCFGTPLLPLRAGIAVFPQDGWTLEELLRHAEEDWRPNSDDPRPISRMAE